MNQRPFWLGALLFVMLSYAGFVIYTGPAIQEVGAVDLFVYVDGAWRVLQGQRPHVDFTSSLGFGVFLLFALGFQLFGLTVWALPGIIALVGVCVALWCFAVSADRLRPWLSALLATVLGTFCMAPAFLGEDFKPTTYAGFYNRLGHALVVILFAELLLPLRDGTTRLADLAFGASSGAIAWILAVTKITFLLPAGVGLLLGVLTRRRSRAWWLGLGAALVAGALFTTVYLRGDPLSIVRDFALVARARGDRLGDGAAFPVVVQMTWRALTVNWGKVFEVVYLEWDRLGMLALAAVLTSAGTALRREDKLNLLAVPVLLPASLFVTVTSWHWSGCPTIAFLAVLLAGASLRVADRRDGGSPTGMRALAISGLAVLACAQPILQASLSFLYAEASKRPLFRLPTAQAVDAPPYRGLYMVALGGCAPDGYSLSPQGIEDGLKVLKAAPHPEGRIMVVDFSNPFSFALRRKSPRGDSVSWQRRASFSTAHFVPPDRVLGEVDLAMVARCPVELATEQDLLKIYGPTLNREFDPVVQTRYWILMARRAAS